ncbi:MAG: DEAD/DEAH box helicase [Anaerolineaceae bacterium]|nr:DEAD/DEAH box helicase [Anaerolineaceae bacterium]
MNLRPYQEAAKEAVLGEWAKGHRKTVAVLPTGTGKTILFASIIEHQVRQGGRALILAHRGELLEQAADKLRKSTGIESALEKAESTSLGSMFPVTVGSVQSMMQPKRLAQFPPDYYSDIVIDEAHHVLSDSYQRVLEHFPTANIVGVTATPDRGDKRNLGQFFDSQAYEYSMRQAIKDGYLVPIKAQMIPLEVNIQSVGVSNGDYALGDIGEALDPYLEQIAHEMKHYCAGRKTVVFLPLIATSQKFCRMLQDEGMKACEVNGYSTDRAEILADFEAGKYDVLCNSMLLTEGWDCPAVDCVVVLRPTKVRALYQQMVGRGMRLSPGKEDLLILDFLWMTERHDLCRPSSLIAKSEEIAAKMDEKLKEDDQQHDLLEEEKEAEQDVVRQREKSLAAQLDEMRNRKSKLVDPIQFAFSIAAEDLVNYEPVTPWEKGPASEKQLTYLEKMGIDRAYVPNMGMASLYIGRLISRRNEGLSTPKQIRYLEKRGFKHVGTWSFSAASDMMSILAKNNWSVPYGIIPEMYVPAGA